MFWKICAHEYSYARWACAHDKLMFWKICAHEYPLPDARWAYAHDNSDHDNIKSFCRCMKPFHEKNRM